MKTLLVVGTDHVVGANVACALSDRFSVAVLTSRRSAVPRGDEFASADAALGEDDAQIARQVLDANPAWIVYCDAASTSAWDVLPRDENQPGSSTRAAASVADAASALGCPMTVISSDAAFAGPRLFHAEDSPRHGQGTLAEVAAATEAAVQRPGVLVVRTHAYGWCPQRHGASDATAVNYAHRYAEQLIAGDRPSADVNRHATPILATDLAEFLFESYRRGLEGLYHVAGAERVNPRRFAMELSLALGRPCALVDAEDPRHFLDAAADAPTAETSLVSHRAQAALERPLPMLREGLRRFAEQAVNGYRQQVSGELALSRAA